MRRYTMSEREAYRHLRPQSRSDRQSLMKISGYLTLIVVFVAGILYLQYRTQREREQTWASAVATIEDVRTQIAIQANSQGGGVMLYDVQIFAKYSADGSMHEKWITIQQLPKLLPDAQLQAFRWKGKTCFVRWKHSDPSRIFAEVS